MQPQALLLSLLAVGAVAKPLVERDYKYEYQVVTKVVTVGPDGSEPTGYGQPAPHHGGHRGYRHKHKKPVKPSVYQPPFQGRPTRTHKAPVPKVTNSAPKQPFSGSYSDIVVLHHNAHRANHSAPDIQWDDALASTAQKIAETCVYAHNTDMDGGGYGQNIAAGISSDKIGDAITDGFYNGEVNYYTGMYGSEPSMSEFEKWGHFSQIVWKSSTKVGCATCDCSGSGLSGTSGGVSPYFTVCNYKGPGNFGGEYADNIGEPRGHPSINGDYRG